MARIAVDIDDTLYSFCDLARRLITEEGFRTGDKQLIQAAYAPWPEWRTPPDLIGLDRWLEVIGWCHDSELIVSQTPYDGARETLDELVDAGHDLLYISNRATETEEATAEWLRRVKFPFHPAYSELVVTDQDKKPFLADCQYLIDDRPKTLVNFIFDPDWDEAGPGARRAFALTKEFNRGLTDVPHIYLAPTWAGLRYYMAGKGLIKELAFA